jgi:hypothetical protein
MSANHQRVTEGFQTLTEVLARAGAGEACDLGRHERWFRHGTTRGGPA